MLLEHSLLKQTIPPLLLLLYLMNGKTKKTDPIFHALIVGLYFFVPLYLTVYLSGFNLLTLVTNSWRTWATPTQYAVFMILAYELTYNKTQDASYSMVLSVHMASAAGYLYEIPRYLTLQGVRGIIRFNKFSVFRIDYAILAVFVVLWLVWKNGVKVNRARVLFGGYCLYTIWYFYNFNYFQSLKYIYAWVYGVRVPWVCIFRVPTMVFLLSLTKTLNTHTHTPIYNEVSK